jgi:hypothetical protein
MDVLIDKIVSVIRTVDDALAPQTMQRVVRAAVQAMREDQAHQARARSERRVGCDDADATTDEA